MSFLSLQPNEYLGYDQRTHQMNNVAGMFDFPKAQNESAQFPKRTMRGPPVKKDLMREDRVTTLARAALSKKEET